MSQAAIESPYRWVIVAAGGLLGCVAIGAMFSLPVLLRPISEDTGWSTTGVSTAMTIGFLALAFASMFWGTLSDRFGPRVVVIAGSALLAGSLALASHGPRSGDVPADRDIRRQVAIIRGLAAPVRRHPDVLGFHGEGTRPPPELEASPALRPEHPEIGLEELTTQRGLALQRRITQLHFTVDHCESAFERLCH